MVSFWVRVLLVLATTLGMYLPVGADTAPVPEYEGVYLVTSKNEVIPLSSMDPKPCEVMTSGPLEGKIRFEYGPLEQLERMPVIVAEVKGFYVVSRVERFLGVGRLAPLEPYIAGKPVATGFLNGGCRSSDLRDMSNYYAFSNSGLPKSYFRVKLISQFATYVELLHPDRLAPSVISAISPDAATISSFGAYLATTEHVYPFMPREALVRFLRSYEINRGKNIRVNSIARYLLNTLEKSLRESDGTAEEWRTLAEVRALDGDEPKALALYSERVIPMLRASGRQDALKLAEERLRTLPTQSVVGDVSGSVEKKANNPRVVLETSEGTIVVELFQREAPKSVDNFLQYVRSGFYNDTIFHRVVKGFVVQGGGFDTNNKQKETRESIQNEADNRLPNERGSLAMARTSSPQSASSQFFVNVQDNAFLNHTSKTAQGWGYAVFGKVVEGMDVVDRIAAVPVSRDLISDALPQRQVVLRRAVVATVQ